MYLNGYCCDGSLINPTGQSIAIYGDDNADLSALICCVGNPDHTIDASSKSPTTCDKGIPVPLTQTNTFPSSENDYALIAANSESAISDINATKKNTISSPVNYAFVSHNWNSTSIDDSEEHRSPGVVYIVLRTICRATREVIGIGGLALEIFRAPRNSQDVTIS